MRCIVYLFLFRFFLLLSLNFELFLLFFSFLALSFLGFLDLYESTSDFLLQAWIARRATHPDVAVTVYLVLSSSESLGTAEANAVTPASACSKLLCAGAILLIRRRSGDAQNPSCQYPTRVINDQGHVLDLRL